ncbi:MAG: DUF2764 family protein [Gemmataceae bacterium]
MHYYMLIASLPHLPPHFDVERPPITWPRLEQRLKLLREQDLVVFERLANFLAWDRQPLDRTDEEVVAEYDKLMSVLRNRLVIDIVNHRMDVRTIVSALRRRRDGKEPPIGVGRLVEPIRRNWQDPFFQLQRRHLWIEEFATRMLAGEAAEAERLLFEVTWKTWSRMAAEEFTFSFEAVLLYIARWAIVDRWTSRDVEKGRARFEELIEETLGDHANFQS